MISTSRAILLLPLVDERAEPRPGQHVVAHRDRLHSRSGPHRSVIRAQEMFPIGIHYSQYFLGPESSPCALPWGSESRGGTGRLHRLGEAREQAGRHALVHEQPARGLAVGVESSTSAHLHRRMPKDLCGHSNDRARADGGGRLNGAVAPPPAAVVAEQACPFPMKTPNMMLSTRSSIRASSTSSSTIAADFPPGRGR
jgi:hypothetical protein